MDRGIAVDADSHNEHPAAKLQIERIASVDGFGQLNSGWAALEATLSPRTPFSSTLWNTLWWKHLRRRRAAIQDELYSYVVHRGGELIAVAPMMLTHAPARGLWRTRKLQFLGADPNITEIRGLITRPGDEAAVVEALNDVFAARRREWDWLEWSGLRQGGPAVQRLAGEPGARLGEPRQDFYLRLPASWAEFKSSRSRNIKESLRKCYNSLKRDGHRFNFRVNVGPGDTIAALERFFELHRARALLSSAVPHPDHFQRANARNFLHEYAAQTPQHGALHVFELQIGGTVVASRVGFALGTELYLYYSGYRPEWGRYSVMTTLLAETMQWAIRNAFTLVNLSTGDDESKRRWGPDEAAFARVVQVGPNLRNRLAYRVYNRSTRRHGQGTKT